MSIRILQLHKRASYDFKHIQDKCEINHTTKSFALADGTTQSFHSEIWAEIITKNFVLNPNFNVKSLLSSLAEWVSEYKNVDFKFSSNPATASLEKTKQNQGGTSTLIGIQFSGNDKIDIISCGDSNLFLLDGENIVQAFPYSDVDSLDSNNQFINTEQLILNKIDDTFFKQISIPVNKINCVILATDALSRLLLRKPETISELLKIQKFEQLHEFCLKKWEDKELEEDDISAIIIPVLQMDSVKYIIPPDDFSFPKEQEVEFIPTSLTQNKQVKYTDMEMNEIRNQFNGVAKDFNQIKNKQKSHEILLIVAIGLLTINILLLVFLSPINTKSNDATSKNKTKNTEHIKQIRQLEKLSEEEAKNRQDQLKKEGYKISVDGIWGEQSQKYWNESQQKNNKKQ